jgi:hypothetical protein
MADEQTNGGDFEAIDYGDKTSLKMVLVHMLKLCYQKN